MSEPRLDRHSRIHHELFDENTAQVGSLGDIVEKHAGDAVFLTPSERGIGGADGGEEDFIAEMNETDPEADEGMDPEDILDGQSGITNAADQTGTVAGIARGFGTHMSQDLGRDGFQIEELPDIALSPMRPRANGEELDDYDDDKNDGIYDQSTASALASQPGANPVSTANRQASPQRIAPHDARSSSQDDALDATRRIR